MREDLIENLGKCKKPRLQIKINSDRIKDNGTNRILLRLPENITNANIKVTIEYVITELEKIPKRQDFLAYKNKKIKIENKNPYSEPCK